MRMSRFWIVTLLFAFVSARAEGPKENKKPDRPKEGPPKEAVKPDVHPHLRAAYQYERMSKNLTEKAETAPTDEAKANLLSASENFKKLAAMKREALKTEKEGKAYDWKAYEEIKGKNEALMASLKAGEEKSKKQPEAPKLKPEMKNMPEKVDAPKEEGSATKMKTSGGFQIKTKVGE